MLITAPRRLTGALGLATTLVLALTVPGASAPMPAATAWFDQPTSGSSHQMGPVSVTVHATDVAGVSAIHLWVGDSVLGVEAIDGPPPVLASATFAWTPEAPGQYLLTARGAGATGTFGAPARVVVTVGDGGEPPSLSPTATPVLTPVPTTVPTQSPTPPPTRGPTPSPTARPTPSPTARPTPSPTPRPTPSPTPRPTPPPCSPPPPLLLAPPNGAVIRDPGSNPPTFRWAYRTPPACTPTGYRIQVYDDPDMTSLVIDVTLGNVGEWTPATTLADCTTYYWRMAARASGRSFGPWSSPSSFELFIGRC